MSGLCICAGCSTQQGEKYTIEDLDNLAEIRIYSAENNELINTISDEEQLYQYNQSSLFDDSDIVERQDELEKELEGGNGTILFDFIQISCCTFWQKRTGRKYYYYLV